MSYITLASEKVRVSIVPQVGAGIADFSVLGPTGYFYPMMRRAAPEEANASLLGCFVMAPWANRIAGAKFVFEGKEIALKANTGDGMAQHGDVRKRAWSVETQDGSSVTLAYESAKHADSNWPWRYSCRVRYAIAAGSLSVELEVTNKDARPFPAGCGLHPYFERRLWDDGDEIVVRAPCAGRYPVSAGCATGPAEEEALTKRLRDWNTVPEEHVDAVLGGFGGEATLRWPGSGVELRMRASEPMGHLVYFAPRAKGALPFIAVEPQTMVNDGFNLAARGQSGTGVRVLAPGEMLRAGCVFEVATL